MGLADKLKAARAAESRGAVTRARALTGRAGAEGSAAVERDDGVAIRAREDFQTFAELVLRDDEGGRVRMEPFHLLMLRWLEWCFAQGKYCLLLAPRGHAKTTYFVVGYILWRLGKNPDLLVKLVSNAEDVARARLNQIGKVIRGPEEGDGDSPDDFHGVFPDCMPSSNPRDPWNTEALTLKRLRGGMATDATLQGYGIDGTITGGRSRLIVLDDVVDEKNALKEPRRRASVIRTVQSTLIQTMKPNSHLLAVGTRWHAEDLYSTCDGNVKWRVLQIGVSDAIDRLEVRGFAREEETGNPVAALPGAVFRGGVWESEMPLWESYMSRRYLIDLRSGMDDRTFGLAYQNKIVGDGEQTFLALRKALREDEWPPAAPVREGWMKRASVGLDPAPSGRRGTGLVVLAQDAQDRVHVAHVEYLATRPLALMRRLVELVWMFDLDGAGLETNNYQGALVELIEDLGEEELTDGRAELAPALRLLRRTMVGVHTTGKTKRGEASTSLPKLDVLMGNGGLVIPSAVRDAHGAVCQSGPKGRACAWCSLIRQLETHRMEGDCEQDLVMALQKGMEALVASGGVIDVKRLHAAQVSEGGRGRMRGRHPLAGLGLGASGRFGPGFGGASLVRGRALEVRAWGT